MKTLESYKSVLLERVVVVSNVLEGMKEITVKWATKSSQPRHPAIAISGRGGEITREREREKVIERKVDEA